MILDMGFVIEYKLLPQHLYLNWKILLEISLIDQLEKNKIKKQESQIHHQSIRKEVPYFYGKIFDNVKYSFIIRGVPRWSPEI